MGKWIIQDWMSNHVYRDKTFTSFDDARDFISEVASNYATAECEKLGDYSEEKFEELHTGICEDLYAVEVKE